MAEPQNQDDIHKDLFGSSDEELETEDAKADAPPKRAAAVAASEKTVSAEDAKAGLSAKLGDSSSDSDDDLELDASSDDDEERRLEAQLQQMAKKKKAPAKKRQAKAPAKPRAARKGKAELKSMPKITKKRKTPAGEIDEDGVATQEDLDFIEKGSDDDENDDSDTIKTKGGWGDDSAIEGSDDEGKEERRFLDSVLGVKKKSKKALTEKQLAEIAQNFKQKMDQAFHDDIISLKDGRPALEKLSMLGEVQSMMRKEALREKFIECGVLEVFFNWLEPLTDVGPKPVFPNSTLRKGIIDTLDEMTDPKRGGTLVETNFVEQSGIGKIIQFYRLKEKDPAVKKMAQRLIDRWARPALNVGTLNHDKILESQRGKKARLTVRRDQLQKDEKALEVKNEKRMQEHLAKRAENAKIGTAGFEFAARFPAVNERRYTANPGEDSKMQSTVERLEDKGMSLEEFLKGRKATREMDKSINKALANNRKRVTSMVKQRIDSRQLYD